MSFDPGSKIIVLTAPFFESVRKAIHFLVVVGADGQDAADEKRVRENEAKLIDASTHVARLVQASVQVRSIQRQQVHIMEDQARELLSHGNPSTNVVQQTFVPVFVIMLLNEENSEKNGIHLLFSHQVFFISRFI